MDGTALMREALRLAARGRGYVSPNPMVGAVVVREGAVIASGYHRRFGEDHAEVVALQRARDHTHGATLYVNLEPCEHFGKTPPCTEAIIRAGISRVIIGETDPNPHVSGGGRKALEQAGISVQTGLMRDECRRLNEAYYRRMEQGVPLVAVKVAQTLDGKIARRRGRQTWITSEPARRFTHRLRATHDAVLVGRRTIEVDDPLLTTRLVRGRSPLRIVLDSRLRVPRTAKIFAHPDSALVATTRAAPEQRMVALRRLGIEVLVVRSDLQGRINLKDLLKKLAHRDINSMLVEGGAAVFHAFLGAGLVDRLYLLLAPRIFGTGVAGFGEESVDGWGERLRFVRQRRLGDDILIEAELATAGRHA